jgi:hypothetical protein
MGRAFGGGYRFTAGCTVLGSLHTWMCQLLTYALLFYLVTATVILS